MKTMIAAIAFIGAGGLQVSADDSIAFDFAGCAGRFSAEMEHAWLMNDPDARHHEEDRATFVTLTEASLAQQQGRAILSHRIEVKLAHSSLLQQATFDTRPRRADAARRMATQHLSACRTMLLGS
ncbi:hypothetical protein [uncultured Tateyamaria sp.]|uniref:hypothetical protein n=1 Tax=uncultured Tateyamaria sp. TaxID=455651 RepID=UPI002612AF9E|nr:hypothetical protein [uncultured Tateyamaria sp.]